MLCRSRVRSASTFVAVILAAAITGGCSGKSSTDPAQPGASSNASTAADSSTVASNAQATVAAPAAGATGVSGSGAALIYPGATIVAGRSGTIPDGKTRVDFYDTKDDGTKVAGWYDAHLPSDWTRSLGAPGKKITGIFGSPDDRIGMMVTTNPDLGTEIQISTDTSK